MLFRFLGLDLDDRVPDHSTISQNRRRRFQGKNLFRRLFEHILHLCMEKRLVDGKIILTDSTHVKASASFKANRKVLAERETADYMKRPDRYEALECERLEASGAIKPQHARRVSDITGMVTQFKYGRMHSLKLSRERTELRSLQ